MTRIVMISGFRIFPAESGAHVRSGGIARALARLGYDVVVYSLAGRRPDYRMLNPASAIVSLEHRLIEETHLGLGFGVLQAANRRVDLPRYWQYPLLRRGLIPAGLKSRLDAADVVISDTPFCPPVARFRARRPWFLISHNLEHRLLEGATGMRRLFASRVRAVEAEAPSQYTDIFACTEDDQAFFLAHDRSGRLTAPIVRCGVDGQAYVPDPDVRDRVRRELGISADERVLLFSASAYAPNVEALGRLQSFARANGSLLRDERLRILVVGSVARHANLSGALMTTGRVEDAIRYFCAADAGLNPVTQGAGANVKLFEYMAARLPILSTPFGVRGSALEPDVDYVPLAADNLERAILAFTRGRTPAAWRAHADGVWQRHRRASDIGMAVADALAALPTFPPR